MKQVYIASPFHGDYAKKYSGCREILLDGSQGENYEGELVILRHPVDGDSMALTLLAAGEQENIKGKDGQKERESHGGERNILSSQRMSNSLLCCSIN